MRLPLAKRITIDNAPEEMQQTINTLSLILNPFMSDVVDTINGRLNFDNFESKLTKIDVKTDANGNIKGTIDVAPKLGRYPIGQICVNVVDSSNSGRVPNITGTPYLLYTSLDDGILRISKILNLGPNSNYTLTIWFL